MKPPLCRVCNERHSPRDPHIWPDDAPAPAEPPRRPAETAPALRKSSAGTVTKVGVTKVRPVTKVTGVTKFGRPPIGTRAMSAAERMRRYRAAKRVEQQRTTTEGLSPQ